MARPEKFTVEQVLDQSRFLANNEGIGSLTMSRVARSLGAPSGSLYHRFASRDMLVASLWLRSVERFQEGFLVALNNRDPIQAALDGARHVVTWSQENLDDAQFLLLHRRQDLIGDEWPAEIRDRNSGQEHRANRAMADLCSALGATRSDEVDRVNFAVITMPMGAVRPALSRGQAPTPLVESLTLEAATTLLSPFNSPRSCS